MAWHEIARFGRKVVAAGLTSSRFGNISQCQGEKIHITCTGSMLDELDQSLIVEVERGGPCEMDRQASSETCVHRSIYQSTPAQAVIHTHSPFAAAFSLLERDVVEPLDSEGFIFLGAMPIVEGHFGSKDLAAAVSSAMQSHNACIARGHGVFAAGGSLSDAFAFACMAEHSAKVRYLVKAYPSCERV